MPNYKLLAAALEKAGITAPLDMPQLTKGQPGAHLELMQKIYALSTPATPAVPARGLKPMDANAANSQANSQDAARSGKMQASRGAKRAAEHAIVEDHSAGETDDMTTAPVDNELRTQLELCRAELLASQLESISLREEADFYIKKLGACHMWEPAR